MAAPTFDSTVTFPTDISEGASGGSRKPTRFVVMPSGREQRIKLWTTSRREYTIDMGSRTPTQGAALIAFWEGQDGGLRAFRFRDWADYQVTNEPLAPTGAATVQLVRSYVSGSQTRVRNIYAPVASPAVTLRKNAGAFAGFTLDTTTGLVTLTALITKTITAITQANPAVVTVGAAHGFANGDLVAVSGVVGMTQINGVTSAVTATAATTITLGAVNSVSFSAYVSGGTAVKYLTNTDVLDWTGTFDTVVRFDQQQQSIDLPQAFEREWTQIKLIEVIG